MSQCQITLTVPKHTMKMAPTMTPKQLSALIDLQRQNQRLDRYLRGQRRQLNDLCAQFDTTFTGKNQDFTSEEISDLLRLNQRLAKLELHLCNIAETESEKMKTRVADPDDSLDDYEIDATIYFVLHEDDPTFDDSDDNFLTQRNFSLKRLDRSYGLGDGLDHRESQPYFPPGLEAEAHCWLFHDLYDHCYGLEQPALSLHDCLRIGTIWVDVAVRHQATLNIDAGNWAQPITQIPSR
jgi:hypothetical protein